MVDVALVVVACVVPVVLVFLNLIILAKYLDPQHAKGHWCSKLVILFGLLLAECAILLLPLDVGNRAGVVGCGFWNDNCGGLDLVLVWEIVYLSIAVMVILILPFLIFYYESMEDIVPGAAADHDLRDKSGSCRGACCSAICYEFFTLVVVLGIMIPAWLLAGQTRIPTKATTINVDDSTAFRPVSTSRVPANFACGSGSCEFEDDTLEMEITFILYMATLLSFIGWFLFSIYAGIGLVGLPLDLCNAWRHRPKLMTKMEMKNAKDMLRRKAQDLVLYGERLGDSMISFKERKPGWSERRKQARQDKKELTKYRIMVETLEHELEEFEECNPDNFAERYNPLVPFGKLLLGIFSTLISLLWIVHIIVFMVIEPPASTFLNKYLIWLDSWFGLFGTLSVGVFSMYLLFAVTKGNFKFGIRFLLVNIHPMEIGKTLINTFLFNVALILLCVLPVVQFTTDAFAVYARLTDAELIFGAAMRYTEGFVVLWDNNVFLYMMMGFAFLALIYFSWCPSDRDHVQTMLSDIRSKSSRKRHEVDVTIRSRGGAIEGTEMTEWGKGKKRGGRR